MTMGTWLTTDRRGQCGEREAVGGPHPHVPGQVWSLLTLTRPSDRTRAIRSSAHGAFLPLLFVLFFKKKKLYICFVWSLLLVANRDERKERFRFACFLKRIEYILMQPFWLLACFCIQTSHTFTLVKHHFTFSLHDFTFSLHDFFSASLSK